MSEDMQLLAKADSLVHDLPEQTPFPRKSVTTVALQLIKRFRDIWSLDKPGRYPTFRDAVLPRGPCRKDGPVPLRNVDAAGAMDRPGDKRGGRRRPTAGRAEPGDAERQVHGQVAGEPGAAGGLLGRAASLGGRPRRHPARRGGVGGRPGLVEGALRPERGIPLDRDHERTQRQGASRAWPRLQQGWRPLCPRRRLRSSPRVRPSCPVFPPARTPTWGTDGNERPVGDRRADPVDGPGVAGAGPDAPGRTSGSLARPFASPVP